MWVINHCNKIKLEIAVCSVQCVCACVESEFQFTAAAEKVTHSLTLLSGHEFVDGETAAETE